MWNIDGGCISVTSGHRWAVDLPHTGMQTSTATARGNHTHRRRRQTSTDKLTIADIIMAASPPLRSRRLVAVLAFVVGSALLVTPATADDISARRRRVLVTGASRGIGREIASKLAAGGDCVCIGYCTGASHAEEALAALEGTGHCMVQADLSQPGEAQALVERAVAGLGGPLDVVVANHGIYEETPIAETPLADWCASFERVLRINLMAPAELAHCAASHMGADGGAIVFVSSRGAYRGEPDAAAYGASKAGLNSLTGSLAQALGPRRIRVSAVAPGFIATDMAKPVLEGPRGDGIRAQSTWGRVGTPAEVAAVVAFLASDEATWCTGGVVDANGASYLH